MRDGWVGGFNLVLLAHRDAMPAQETALISVMDFHEQLRHPNIAITKSTAKAGNVKVSRTVTVCEQCVLGKAKKTSVPKEKSQLGV